MEARGHCADRGARLRRRYLRSGAPEPDLAGPGHAADDRFGGGAMRPTIGEQLGGACRILEAVVAPEVAGTPAGDVLRGLVKNLRMLQTSWAAVLPFLHWDNELTAGLLARAVPSAPDALAQRIMTALAAEPARDPADVASAQDRK